MGIGTSLLVPLIAGGTVICARDFIPSDFPDILKTFQPTIYAAGPALLAGILRNSKGVHQRNQPTIHSGISGPVQAFFRHTSARNLNYC